MAGRKPWTPGIGINLCMQCPPKSNASDSQSLISPTPKLNDQRFAYHFIDLPKAYTQQCALATRILSLLQVTSKGQLPLSKLCRGNQLSTEISSVIPLSHKAIATVHFPSSRNSGRIIGRKAGTLIGPTLDAWVSNLQG